MQNNFGIEYSLNFKRLKKEKPMNKKIRNKIRQTSYKNPYIKNLTYGVNLWIDRVLHLEYLDQEDHRTKMTVLYAVRDLVNDELRRERASKFQRVKKR